MTSFEAGFAKYAEECGLTEQQSAHILKRAMDYPGAQSAFKTLPQGEGTQQTPGELEILQNLMQQYAINNQMNGAKKTIQM